MTQQLSQVHHPHQSTAQIGDAQKPGLCVWDGLNAGPGKDFSCLIQRQQIIPSASLHCQPGSNADAFAACCLQAPGQTGLKISEGFTVRHKQRGSL